MESQQPQSRGPILAAFSPESAAREPLEFGHAASRLTGAPLVIVAIKHVVVATAGGDVWDSPDEARTIEHLRLGLQRRGLRDVKVEVMPGRTIASGLKDAVEKLKPQLLVLGSSHRGRLGSVLVGDTAEHVLHDGACPVAVVPKGYESPEAGVQTIGAAFAPTDEGKEALRVAAMLAYARGVRLRAIAVVEREGAEGEAETQVRDALGALAEDVTPEVDVRSGDPTEGLVAASQDVDLMVIGSRGRGARRAALFGSVTSKVAGNAGCPILIVPPGAAATAEALAASIEAPRTD